MMGLSPEEKQRYRIEGVANAWLDKPVNYRLELRLVIEYLGVDEDVAAAFPVFLSGSLLGGVLFVTERRLLFVRRGVVTRRRRVVEFDYQEIAGIEEEQVGQFENLRLRLTDGRSVRIKSTFSSRKGMSELRKLIEQRLPT